MKVEEIVKSVESSLENKSCSYVELIEIRNNGNPNGAMDLNTIMDIFEDKGYNVYPNEEAISFPKKNGKSYCKLRIENKLN
jgi:hypothetical protein